MGKSLCKLSPDSTADMLCLPGLHLEAGPSAGAGAGAGCRPRDGWSCHEDGAGAGAGLVKK